MAAFDALQLTFECQTCRAVWSNGRWTWGCAECGGGALRMPCDQCLGGCGAVFERAAIDSNDAHLAHLIGRCAEVSTLKTKVQQWAAVKAELLLLSLAFDATALRAQLIDWSSDRAWQRRPRGPERLQVLLDSLLERGVEITPRALAKALFQLGVEPTGQGLTTLPLRQFFNNSGSLVLCRRLDGPVSEGPMPMAMLRVMTIIAEGNSWLSDDLLDEVPCAGVAHVPVGQHCLGVLAPSNDVPGLLMTEHLLVDAANEAELVDWHRHLVAHGDPDFR